MSHSDHDYDFSDAFSNTRFFILPSQIEKISARSLITVDRIVYVSALLDLWLRDALPSIMFFFTCCCGQNCGSISLVDVLKIVALGSSHCGQNWISTPILAMGGILAVMLWQVSQLSAACECD